MTYTEKSPAQPGSHPYQCAKQMNDAILEPTGQLSCQLSTKSRPFGAEELPSKALPKFLIHTFMK